MTDLHDAVATLVRIQTQRVNYLPGDPDRFYTVRAPCLLAQLHLVVASSTGGRGGRTVPGGRLPLAADALDLWVEVVGNVHGWADNLGIDRLPYRAAEHTTFAPPERMPGWARRAWPWMGAPSRLGESVPPEPAPAVHRLTLDDSDPLADRTMPPVGHLLKATAARAESLAVDAVIDRMTFVFRQWAGRIGTLLVGQGVEERIHQLRGQACDECGATTVTDDRDGERFVRPAVEVRFMGVDGGEPGDLWAYRTCLACGDNGWVDYSTETPGAAA